MKPGVGEGAHTTRIVGSNPAHSIKPKVYTMTGNESLLLFMVPFLIGFSIVELDWLLHAFFKTGITSVIVTVMISPFVVFLTIFSNLNGWCEVWETKFK